MRRISFLIGLGLTAVVALRAALPVLAADTTAAVQRVASEQDAELLAKAQNHLLAGYASKSGSVIMRPEEVAQHLAGRNTAKALAAANSLAAEGRAAYRKLAFDSAAKKLNAAQAGMRKLLPHTDEIGLADVLLDLGLVHLEAGRGPAAVEAFKRARFFGAPRALDPRFFPKTAMDSYAKGSATAEGGSLATLNVRTRPGGARVFLDGRKVGTSPVIVKDLVPGVHTLRVRSKKGTAWKRVRCQAGTNSTTLSIPESTLRPMGAWFTDVDRAFRHDLQVGEAVGAQRVLVFGIDATGAFFLSVIDVENAVLLFHGTRPIGAAAAQLRSLGQEAGAQARATTPSSDIHIDQDL